MTQGLTWFIPAYRRKVACQVSLLQRLQIMQESQLFLLGLIGKGEGSVLGEGGFGRVKIVDCIMTKTKKASVKITKPANELVIKSQKYIASMTRKGIEAEHDILEVIHPTGKSTAHRKGIKGYLIMSRFRGDDLFSVVYERRALSYSERLEIATKTITELKRFHEECFKIFVF